MIVQRWHRHHRGSVDTIEVKAFRPDDKADVNVLIKHGTRTEHYVLTREQLLELVKVADGT